MRKLSGKITCIGKRRIQAGSIVNIEALECLVDSPSNVLGSISFQSSSFPILFEISYDETPILRNFYNGNYILSVTIQKKDKILYANSGQSFVFEHMKKILDNIELEVSEV